MLLKYCNNCGNKLHENQKYCSKCGKSTESANSENNNNGRKVIMMVLIILVFLILIAGLIFGGYKLFLQNDNSNLSHESSSKSYINKIENNRAKNDENEKQIGEDSLPSIDVLTESFSTDFMNEDHREGFASISLGMSKAQVKSKFGEPNETVTVAGMSAERYGSIAVHYDNETVDRYFIVPETDTTVYQFTSQHGEPTMKADEGGIVYDDNPHNSFSIKVYVDESGKVTGIENVEAVPRSDVGSSDDSDDNEDSSEKIANKSDAESAAIRVLGFSDVDIWVHSVTDEGEEFRVNYGKENEDRAHRYVLINKETGMATGDTTGEE